MVDSDRLTDVEGRLLVIEKTVDLKARVLILEQTLNWWRWVALRASVVLVALIGILFGVSLYKVHSYVDTALHNGALDNLVADATKYRDAAAKASQDAQADLTQAQTTLQNARDSGSIQQSGRRSQGQRPTGRKFGRSRQGFRGHGCAIFETNTHSSICTKIQWSRSRHLFS